MDRDQQRQNRRNTATGFSCTAGAELTPLRDPAGRPAAACDPIPAVPAPLPAVAPVPCPAPAPAALNLPPGLTVSNDATVAYCPSTAGYSVTGTTSSGVATGAQQQLVLFTSISSITENQLNYLYDVVPSSSTAIISAALSGATTTVVDLTHLNYDQSEELIISIQTAKFTVDTLAVEQARNLLVCQVENNQQVAVCPTSAYFGPSGAVPPGMQYVPSATSATGSVLVTFALSPTSGDQAAFEALNIPSLTAAGAQANLLALAQASSSLRCVYGNAETAAACCTSEAPYNNLGFTNCVPATGPTIEGSPTAVGYFTVTENTVFSVVSLQEANSVARELSRNSLNCYFPSTGLTATCVGLGLTAPFAADSTTSVYLEPGAVILYDLDASVTAANAQALTIAQAALNCFWSNSEQTAFCPPSGTFTAINNVVYNLDASSTASLHYSSVVAANTVISYESQADANAQALELARANVSCVYCNEAIPATCSGGINETIGASADLICNVLAEVAQNTAISLGNILVSTSDGGLNCCYGNEGVTSTNKCGTGAYFSSDTGTAFTSADTFYLPPNIITICANTPTPEPPALYFPYSSLYATDVAQYGCCSDILLCGGLSGSATALPTLWAAQTDLFNTFGTGATFYSDNLGTTPYEFPAGAAYVVSRSGVRAYRGISGATGYTEGLTACASCSTMTEYVFLGSTASNYPSASAAYTDIFCGGPTAQTITLYSPSPSPFSLPTIPSEWYTDACGLSAFNPVAGSGTGNYYYAGYILGSTGYMLRFTTPGGNTALFQSAYNESSCPLSRYPYTVWVGGTSCEFAGATTTLYGHRPAPELFTDSSYTGTTKFYSQQFDDTPYSYPSGTGYINYSAPDLSTYAREISGTTASTAGVCNHLHLVTVQWSNTSPDEVCLYPHFNGPDENLMFNSNIRNVWSTLDDPFGTAGTSVFYTTPIAPAFNTDFFKPGVTGPVYLSEFSVGDTFRSAYRQYTWGDTNSELYSYAGTFKASPFALEYPLWAHSSTGSYMNQPYVGDVENTKFLLSASGCLANTVYSDIKYPVPAGASSNTIQTKTYKKLPVLPVSSDVYSWDLLFDGIGFQLSTSGSGTAAASSLLLHDLSKIGAGFTGAIIRAANSTRIGDYQIPLHQTAFPTYISSINKTSGAITLGGYYNKINTSFSNEPIFVTGFKIEAGSWSGSQFTCYGDLCDKVEVGHSLFSYYVGPEGPTASVGFVNRVVGNTVYYTGAPGYNNFSTYDIGTGASHGSGHVYIQGRQFARFWSDDDKTQPLYFDLQANTSNFVWSQTDGSISQSATFTVAKNFVLGNTAGSTADFIVAGINYASDVIPPRPFTYDSQTLYDAGLDQYYYETYSYSCTGAVSITTVPLTVLGTYGIINSCCDTVAPLYGGATTSACDFYTVHGSTSVDPAYLSGGTAVLVSDGKFYQLGAPLSGNYVMDGGATAPGVFSAKNFSGGFQYGEYPCSSTDGAITPSVGGSAWMRLYLGYYDSGDPLAPVPFDPTYPPSGVNVDDPSYWANNNPLGLTSGYIFKEYVPDPSASPGCNCGNFRHIEYALASGDRYSIWANTDDAWNDVDQLQQISGNAPAMPFNECATGCDPVFTCISMVDCDSGAPGAAPGGIAFSSDYGAIPFFSFSDMPSVGGTAEDLKAEATEIAQNIVNSFVKCFYFNDYTPGKICDDPSYYLVQQGFANAGEIVSNLSKEDANNRAQLLADSRTICISPSILGGGGCANTTIGSASATAFAGGDATGILSMNMSFAKDNCNFTPNVSLSTSLTMEPITVTPITFCSSSGTSITRYVLGFEGDYTDETIKLPVRFE